ncbi:MAG: hypothetical protein JW862_19390 [Anaerolineales bacterium]|nr:hypothetical protein [Anaerolineales bacterium]
MVISAFAGRSRPGVNLRTISAFSKLHRAIGLAVEAGSRLHIGLGRGQVTAPESAAAFVGLSVLERLARSASTGDNPPVATSGEPNIAILSQDTLRSSYQRVGLNEQYDPTAGQLAGLTPFSYAAGSLPLAADEKTGANILIGSFGTEVALITDAGERSGNLTLAGTDNLPAQAVLYATAHEPLIGEEVYAAGAYVNAGPLHAASLQAQDVLRWLLVATILAGVVLHLLGLDVPISEFIEGLL